MNYFFNDFFYEFFKTEDRKMDFKFPALFKCPFTDSVLTIQYVKI